MEIEVEKIRLVAGSSIGYGEGRTVEGVKVAFVGGWRAMQMIGEAMEAAGTPIVADVPDWAVLSLNGD